MCCKEHGPQAAPSCWELCNIISAALAALRLRTRLLPPSSLQEQPPKWCRAREAIQGRSKGGSPPVPVILIFMTGQELKQLGGAERRAAASRLPRQMIKKVAPHVVNEQIGLRKAGVSPRFPYPAASLASDSERVRGCRCTCPAAGCPRPCSKALRQAPAGWGTGSLTVP